MPHVDASPMKITDQDAKAHVHNVYALQPLEIIFKGEIRMCLHRNGHQCDEIATQ